MGEIFRVSFKKEKQSEGKTIQELFESIQLYREEGKSLRKIYSAFSEAGLWCKGRSSFVNEYYAYCRVQKKELLVKKRSPRSKKDPSSAKKTADSSISTESADAKQEEASIYDSDAGHEESASSKPVRELNAVESLEERRAISAALFKEKAKKGIF